MTTGAHRAQDTSELRVVRECEPLPATQLRDGVRHATLDDANALAWLRCLSLQVAFERGVLSEPPVLRDLSQEAARWALRLARGEGAVLVALREGQVVGHVACSLRRTRAEDAPQATIDTFHVEPRFWHAPVAEHLLTACATWVLRHGAASLAFSVLTENVGMQRLLAHAGFVLEAQLARQRRLYSRFVLRLD
jgi:RimJ/RimL family protein N-acetyltransferase